MYYLIEVYLLRVWILFMIIFNLIYGSLIFDGPSKAPSCIDQTLRMIINVFNVWLFVVVHYY